MSTGMDALAISKLLPPGKIRTHTELMKATGLGGSRMRNAIALLAKEGLIAAEAYPPGQPVPQCWRGTAPK